MAYRSPDDVKRGIGHIRYLKSAGYDLFPLKRFDAVRESDGELVGKTPRDKGWQVEDYSSFDWRWWLGQGGNVGVRLGPHDIIIDVDMHGAVDGKATLRKLLADAEWTPPAGTLTVATGSGGLHIYTRIPEPMRSRVQLEAYPGIDFKRVGGFVVAPPSIHPKTLQVYRFRLGPPLNMLPAVMPDTIIELLRKPAGHERRGEGGEISCEDLASLLAVLDPKDFSAYDKWISISAAAFVEWADWCHRDPDYEGESDDQLLHHWDSFESGRDGGATYRTILKAVVDAGHKDLVRGLGRRVEAADDFPDDIEEPDESEPVIMERDTPDEMVVFEDPEEYEE
jgi:hypothetical protein